MSDQNIAPFHGTCYTRLIVERVPEGVRPEVHLQDKVEYLIFDMAQRGVVVRRNRLIQMTIDAPPGRVDGLYSKVKYEYAPPSPRDRERQVTARRRGWENGAIVRRFIQDGTPDEIRSIPTYEVSPFRPGIRHEDPEEALVLDFAWIRGFNAGKKGVRFT